MARKSDRKPRPPVSADAAVPARAGAALPIDPAVDPFAGLEPLASRALFWRAAHLAPSPVLADLPLLFWLVETMRPGVVLTLGVADPVAHLAACQAVARLGLEALCFGLDDGDGGEGDGDGEGGEGGALPGLARRVTAADYADFARVLDGPAERAALRLEGAAIDLLVVNRAVGPALADEIERLWLPRLGPRGAVLFAHGAEAGFGAGFGLLVRRLAGAGGWFVLDPDRQSGLVPVGPVQPERVRRLAGLGLGRPGYLAVRHVFARLGEALVAETARAGAERAAAAAQAEAGALADALAGERAAAEAARAEAARLAGQLAARHARAAELEAAAFDVRAEAEAARAEAGAAQAVAAEETARLGAALAAARAEAAQAAAGHAAELAALTAHAEALAGALAGAQAARERAEAAVEAAERAEAGARARIATAEAAAEGAVAARAAAEAEARARAEALAAAEARAEARAQASAQASVQAAEAALAGERAARAPAEAATREARARAAAAEKALAAARDEAARATRAGAAAGVRAAAEGQARDREQAVRRILAELHPPRDRIQTALARPRLSPAHRAARRALEADRALVESSGLFDAKWYLDTYPDLQGTGFDAVGHFVRLGAWEGRNPGPGFDSIAYHLAHPDVSASGQAALMHFLRHGRDEGRQAIPVTG